MYGRTPDSPWRSAAKIAPCAHSICFHQPELRTQWCPAAKAYFCPTCFEDGLRPYYTEGQSVVCAQMPALDTNTRSNSPPTKKPKPSTIEIATNKFLTDSRNRTGTIVWSDNARTLHQHEARSQLYGPPDSYNTSLSLRLSSELCCRHCSVLIEDCICCQDCGRDITACKGRCEEALSRLKDCSSPTQTPTAHENV